MTCQIDQILRILFDVHTCFFKDLFKSFAKTSVKGSYVMFFCHQSFFFKSRQKKRGEIETVQSLVVLFGRGNHLGLQVIHEAIPAGKDITNSPAQVLARCESIVNKHKSDLSFGPRGSRSALKEGTEYSRKQWHFCCGARR